MLISSSTFIRCNMRNRTNFRRIFNGLLPILYDPYIPLPPPLPVAYSTLNDTWFLNDLLDNSLPPPPPSLLEPSPPLPPPSPPLPPPPPSPPLPPPPGPIRCKYCPEFSSHSLMADFEKGEHAAIRALFSLAAIKGCLFHWKQCLNTKYCKATH